MINMGEGTIIKEVHNDLLMQDKYACQSPLPIGEIAEELSAESGHFVLTPLGTRLINGVKNILQNYIASKLGFEEIMLPKMAKIQTFHDAGILGKWDDYLLSVRPYSDTCGVTDEFLMDPLQCTTLYESLRGKYVDSPIKVYDVSGPTYRNEEKNRLKPLIRQREFHRLEFIYVGERRYIHNIREQCLEQLERAVSALGLSYRVVVGSSCYQQHDFDESIVAVKDLEVFCLGTEISKEMFLELGGASFLGDSQTRRFDIQGAGEICSGCMGIGLERFVYALVSNFGTLATDIVAEVIKDGPHV